jgi:putative ABC transport system permease protein
MAIPTAALGGRLYAGFSAAMLNTTVDGYAIPLWAIALQVALGIALPCVAAAIPIARGIRVPVAVALRDVGIEASGAPQWLNRVRGTYRPTLLSLRNAFRRRARMAFTVITLAMGGAAFLGALDLRTSIRGSVDFVYGTLLRYDASVRLTTPHDIDSLEAIARRLPEVVWAEAWNTAQVITPAEQDLGGSFVATAVPVDTRLVALPIREGRWLVRHGLGEIVVSATLVEEHPELALGRRVKLLVDGRAADWLVVGVADAAGPGPTAFVSRETLSRSRGRHDAATVAFRMRGETPDTRTSAIISVRDAFERAQISVASSQTLDATRHAIEDHLLMVAGFLLVMAQLTIVIGGLGLGSTMSVSVLERTREIGVLRAIGASRASIVALIETEGLVVALLSWLVAVPLSLPISVGVARAFGRIFFPVPVTLTPQPMALALWLIVAVLAAIVSCAWPALRATRVTIANALAYE